MFLNLDQKPRQSVAAAHLVDGVKLGCAVERSKLCGEGDVHQSGEHRVGVVEVAVVLLPALQLHPRDEAFAGRCEKQLRAARESLAGREGGGVLREGGLLGEELPGRSVERVPKLLVVRPLEKREEEVRRRGRRAERALKQRRFLKKRRRGVGNRGRMIKGGGPEGGMRGVIGYGRGRKRCWPRRRLPRRWWKPNL